MAWSHLPRIVPLALGSFLSLFSAFALSGEVKHLPPIGSGALSRALLLASRGDLPATAAAPERELELITERFPNGAVKIERQVAQDAEGNYVNHGQYTEYDTRGKIRRAGEFRDGRQHGKWTRHFQAGECSLFSGSIEKQFPGPFVSEATFEDGKLHGAWTIRSAAGQKIIEWSFDQGVRHGKSTWWHPRGEVRREVAYHQGEPDGDLIEWAPDGKAILRVTFLKGRQLHHDVQTYPTGRTSYEGDYLLPPSVSVPAYDWWEGTAKSIPVGTTGPKQKHGRWIGYYANGFKKVTGAYEFDVPVGKFTWWYENGQKQAEGEYIEGREHGRWITWHPNGQKESEGEYTDGVVSGVWMRWLTNGKKVEVFDYSLEAESGATSDEEPVPPPRPVEPEEPAPLKAERPQWQLPETQT